MIKRLLRNILQNPVFSLLNHLGFGLSTACAFLALLFAWQEYHTDRHFQGAERIYRIGCHVVSDNARGPQKLVPWLQAHYPAIEAAVRVQNSTEKIYVNGNLYEEKKVLQVDSSFFDLFDYPFLAGDAAHALHQPDGVVLSETLARKYFGDPALALGKTLKIGETGPTLQVTGVTGRHKHRSHLDAGIWVPIYAFLGEEESLPWTESSCFNFVRLRAGTPPENIDHILDEISKQEIFPKAGAGMTFEEWSQSESGFRWNVIPLRDIYLNSPFPYELDGGNREKVYGLLLAGGFILLLGCINYINLVTARASVRAKEVGVRKTLGAGWAILLRQFLRESFAFGLLTMLIAFVASEALLMAFKTISGESLLDLSRYRLEQVLGVGLFTLMASVLTGVYPAFFLMRFRPAAVLRGQWGLSGNQPLRNALVVSQFSIVTALLIGGIVVFRQLNFMQNRDWGFQKEGICILRGVNGLKEQAAAFRQEIARQHGVVATSFCSSLPVDEDMGFQTYQTSTMEQPLLVRSFLADADFLSLLDIKIVAGQNFYPNMPDGAILLTESAVRGLGLGDHAVGTKVNDAEVLGVVRDFNVEDLKQSARPAAIRYTSKPRYNLMVKLTAASIPDFTRAAESLWKQMTPANVPFSYTFLDENLAALAEKERILSRSIAFFACLATVIACLGMFGLAAFTLEQRRKEIGIRKVLGASLAGIAGLMAKDFLKLVVIAIVIASPVAYYFMQRWLSDFVHHIEIKGWMFAAAGLLAISIALLTVGFQSVKAALTDPVKSLRSE